MVRRRALVTGATGGLGRELVQQLVAAGYAVRATGRNGRVGESLSQSSHPGEGRDPASGCSQLDPGLRRGGVEFVAADLVRDPIEPLVRDIDVVFHLAALSSPWGREADFRAINVDATQRLLDAARKAGVGAFIHASTPSIYARYGDTLRITEDSPLPTRFINAYAASKYEGECAVLVANTPEFRTVALRPRAIAGPQDTVLLPRLLRAARRGKLALPNGGTALIELTDVRDVATAFLRADQRREQAAGRAINISSGDPRPLRELLQLIFAKTGQRVRLRSVPIGVALAAAGAMERVAALLPGRPEPPLTRYAVAALGYSQTMQLGLARTRLDWTPRYRAEEIVAYALGDRDA